MTTKILFIFLDGIGIGPATDGNPFAAAPMGSLRELLGVRLAGSVDTRRHDLLVTPIDATLGVPGIPQSATGQVSLFTGINAARVLGYHLPAFPNQPLISLIHRTSILKDAARRGLRVTFANAYTPNYFQLVEEGKRTHSATTLCMLAASLPFRYLSDLQRGKAVYWDITGSRIAERGYSGYAAIQPETAGKRLVTLADNHDLVLYECFLPDVIGHKRDFDQACRFLDTLDRFLGAVIREKSPATTIIITSDHGNFEDLSTGAHTLNPVPLLVFGPGAHYFAGIDRITGVHGAILAALADR